jgi:hypothetical protein
MLLLLALWLAVIAVSLPVFALVLGVGLIALVWFSLDDVIATILGHEDAGPGAPALPIEVVRVSQESDDPPSSPPLALPRVPVGGAS